MLQGTGRYARMAAGDDVLRGREARRRGGRPAGRRLAHRRRSRGWRSGRRSAPSPVGWARAPRRRARHRRAGPGRAAGVRRAARLRAAAQPRRPAGPAPPARRAGGRVRGRGGVREGGVLAAAGGRRRAPPPPRRRGRAIARGRPCARRRRGARGRDHAGRRRCSAAGRCPWSAARRTARVWAPRSGCSPSSARSWPAPSCCSTPGSPRPTGGRSCAVWTAAVVECVVVESLAATGRLSMLSIAGHGDPHGDRPRHRRTRAPPPRPGRISRTASAPTPLSTAPARAAVFQPLVRPAGVPAGAPDTVIRTTSVTPTAAPR